MKYTTEFMIEQFNRRENLKYIFFWGHTEKENQVTKACLSQWYGCLFTVDGVVYNTAEQYMMAQKALLFDDGEIYEEIMKASHPKQFKDLGRRITGFQEKIWDENKYQIVVNGNYQKFLQNKDLRTFLTGTGKRVLVEASPYDKIWGVGLSADTLNIDNPNIWKGQNLLGFALMEVRDMLMEESERNTFFA